MLENVVTTEIQRKLQKEPFGEIVLCCFETSKWEAVFQRKSFEYSGNLNSQEYSKCHLRVHSS